MSAGWPLCERQGGRWLEQVWSAVGLVSLSAADDPVIGDTDGAA